MPGPGLTSDRLKVFVPPTESSAILPINVKDPAYGAVGDGVTDDAAAFTAAIAAASGRAIYVPKGTYLFGSTVTAASAVTIYGDGPDQTIFTRSTNALWFNIQGTVGSTINLSGNAAAYATSLTVASNPSLVADNYLLVRSSAAWPGQGSYGEVVRVKSVTGSGPYTINLYGPLDEAYATADTALIQKITMVNGGGFQGVTFQGGGAAETNGAIRYGYSRNARFDHVACRNMAGPGIQFDTSIGWKVTNSLFKDLFNDVNTGYGVNAGGASRDGRVTACEAEGVRHLFTTNGNTDGPPRHIVVADCVGRECYDRPFDTHEGARFVKFVGCEAHSTAVGGFGVRGLDCEIVDCTAFAYNNIAFYVTSNALRARIRGGNVTARGASGVGVKVEADDCDITDVSINETGAEGILVSSGDRLTVQGGKIKSPGSDGGSSSCIRLSAGANHVIQNVKLANATNGVLVDGTASGVRTRGLDPLTVTNPTSGTVIDYSRGANLKHKQTGLIVPEQTNLWTPVANAVVSATQYYGRFVLSEDLTITKLGIYVANAGSAAGSDTVDIGVFASDSTTLVVSSGSTTGKLNSTGLQTVTVASTTLKADTVYYAAFIATIASLGAWTCGSASAFATNAMSSFGGSAGQIEMGKLTSVGPALSTSGIASASSICGLMWLLES